MEYCGNEMNVFPCSPIFYRETMKVYPALSPLWCVLWSSLSSIATGQYFPLSNLTSFPDKGYYPMSIPGINLCINLCLIVCSLELNLQLISGVSNVTKYKLMILKTKHTFKHTKASSLVPLSLIEIYDSPSRLPFC